MEKIYSVLTAPDDREWRLLTKGALKTRRVPVPQWALPGGTNWPVDSDDVEDGRISQDLSLGFSLAALPSAAAAASAAATADADAALADAVASSAASPAPPHVSDDGTAIPPLPTPPPIPVRWAAPETSAEGGAMPASGPSCYSGAVGPGLLAAAAQTPQDVCALASGGVSCADGVPGSNGCMDPAVGVLRARLGHHLPPPAVVVPASLDGDNGSRCSAAHAPGGCGCGGNGNEPPSWDVGDGAQGSGWGNRANPSGSGGCGCWGGGGGRPGGSGGNWTGGGGWGGPGGGGSGGPGGGGRGVPSCGGGGGGRGGGCGGGGGGGPWLPAGSSALQGGPFYVPTSASPPAWAGPTRFTSYRRLTRVWLQKWNLAPAQEGGALLLALTGLVVECAHQRDEEHLGSPDGALALLDLLSVSFDAPPSGKH